MAIYPVDNPGDRGKPEASFQPTPAESAAAIPFKLPEVKSIAQMRTRKQACRLACNKKNTWRWIWPIFIPLINIANLGIGMHLRQWFTRHTVIYRTTIVY